MPLTAIDLGQCQFDRVRLLSMLLSISSRLGIGFPLTGHLSERRVLVPVDEVLARFAAGFPREGSTSRFPTFTR